MNIAFALILATGSSLASTHWTVDGNGYFRMFKNGHLAYSKSVLVQNTDGDLTYDGAKFLPDIQVPSGTSAAKVDLSGNITFVVNGQNVSGGRLVLAEFSSPSHLSPDGPLLDSNAEPTLANPGEGDAGVVRSGQAPMAPQPHRQKVTEPDVQVRTIDPGPQPSGGNFVSTTGGVAIHIHPLTTVDDPSFTLGQIADISAPPATLAKLKGLWIGNANIIGVPKIIDRNIVTLRLEGAHYDPTKMDLVVPEGCEVQRRFQTVSSDLLSQTAIDAVTKSLHIQIPLTASPAPLPVKEAPGAISFSTAAPTALGDGYSVELTINLNGAAVDTITIQLHPAANAPMVHVGDVVNVVMKARTATVQVPGIVRTNGYIGQRVEVEIDNVGVEPTRHMGTVLSADTIEVEL